MDKRGHIREKALELFKQQGNITAREVASLAEVNVASINYYFGNKDSLLLELFHQIMLELNAQLDSILSRVNTLEELKEIFSHEIYEFTLSCPGFFKFVLQMISGSYRFEQVEVEGSDFYTGTVRNFVIEIMNRFSDEAEPREIQNRVIIFITSLAVSLITAGAALENDQKIQEQMAIFKDEAYFRGYINSLIDVIMG